MASEDGHGSDKDGDGLAETAGSSAASSETLFLPLGVAAPQRIGQYTLKRVIGSGSFGTVYEAMQDQPRRPVALKVMRRVTGTPSASSLRRFQFESEILGRLHHPGIAQVYEAGVFDDGMGATPFFVLEYIPNAKTIIEYARDHRLGVRQKLELFARVCDAVYQANLQGIVHRDLKPANILVDPSGQPKVIDFGVARAADSDLAGASQQTNVGELVGTVAYMSPEQIDADPHDIDIRSDVYSLGVVLFELLTSQLPHDVRGKASYEAARVIRDEPSARISKVDPNLRGDLETVVHSALQKDRQWRYQNAGELRENIERFLNRQPLMIRRPSLRAMAGTTFRAFVARRPGWCYAAATVLAFMLAEYLGNPFYYRWTSLNNWFVALQQAALRPTPPDEPLKHVSVIGFSDQTLGQLTKLGTQFGLGDLDLNNRHSIRPLHGLLLKKLSRAGVRAVALDLTFSDPSPEYDTGLIEGFQSLRDAGVPVVFSMIFDDENAAMVAPELARLGQPAWPCSQIAPGHTALEFFVHSNHRETTPSIALAVWAALREPDRKSLVSYDMEKGLVYVNYYTMDPALSGVRKYERRVDTIQCTAIEEFDPDTVNEASTDDGLLTNDAIGVYSFTMPIQNALDQSTLEYAWVLTADEQQLREKLAGRVVLIGFTCPDGEEPVAISKDRSVFGVYFHAAGLDSLLSGESLQVATVTFGRLSLIAACIVGVGLVRPLRTISRHRIERAWHVARTAIIGVGILAVALVAASVAYSQFGYLVNPWVPLLGLLAAWLMALGVASQHSQRLV